MIYIEQEDYEKIIEHCKRELPKEACGLVGGLQEGKKKYIKKVYFLTNVDASREHFSMNPKEQIEAIRDMRKYGYQMLGNFHSHPESDAIPSKEDKRLAYDAKVNYLIVSFLDLKNPVLKAYLIAGDKKVTEEKFYIVASLE